MAFGYTEIAPTGKTEITLEDLAKPFSKKLCEYLKNASKQATSNSSQFLDTCVGFNERNVSYDELINTTVKKGFNNVIEAFHKVNYEDIPIQFYQKDYSRQLKKSS